MTAAAAVVQHAPTSKPGMAALVTFLDDDHVLDVASHLLRSDWAAAEEFLAPETVDRQRLERLAAGLHAGDGLHVSSARDTVEQSTVVVLRRATVTRQLIERCPRLRLIQRLGARADRIDLRAARDHGVEVSCLPRASLVATAEHTLALILALSRRLVSADRALRAGRNERAGSAGDRVAYNWAGVAGVSSIHGRTLGIIGLGEVGTLVASLARALGMRVTYHNRTRLPARLEARYGVEYRSKGRLIAEADVVSVHASGRGLAAPVLDRAAIEVMRPDAMLVNTSRGWLIDEDALYAALTRGTIAGAALDVHASEPRPSGDRFCTLDNVILTPHMAGGSRLGVLDEIGELLDNVRLALRGEAPRHGQVAGAS